MAAVQQNKYASTALCFASEDLQKDHEVVMAAVKDYGRGLQYASKDLQNDREIVMTAVQQDDLDWSFPLEIYKTIGDCHGCWVMI